MLAVAYAGLMLGLGFLGEGCDISQSQLMLVPGLGPLGKTCDGNRGWSLCVVGLELLGRDLTRTNGLGGAGWIARGMARQGI